MDDIGKFKKRLAMAEMALMRIDSLFSDSERPSQIVSEYFEEVNKWWFDSDCVGE